MAEVVVVVVVGVVVVVVVGVDVVVVVGVVVVVVVGVVVVVVVVGVVVVREMPSTNSQQVFKQVFVRTLNVNELAGI